MNVIGTVIGGLFLGLGTLLGLPAGLIAGLGFRLLERFDPEEPVSTRRGVWGTEDYTAE